MTEPRVTPTTVQLMARGRLGVTGARAQKHVEVVYNHEAARAPTLHHNMAGPTVPASRRQHRPVTHTTVQLMERGQTGATGTRVLSRAAEEHKDEKDPAPTPPLNMAAPTVPGVQTLLKLATPILAQLMAYGRPGVLGKRVP